MAINFNYNSNLKLSYIETIINGSKDLESSFTGYGNISSYSSSKIVYKEGSLTLTINGSGFTSDSGDITVTSINYKITNGESFNINCSIKGNIYYSDLTDVLSNVKATKLIYTIPYGVGKFLTQTITADNLFTEYSTSDVKNFKYEISDGIGGNIIFSIPLLKASDYNNVINGNLTLKQQIEFFKSSSFLSGNDNISITKSTELFLNKNGKPELNGYAGNDTLTGSKLSDILNGGTGIDKLIGGKGDDTYIVDNVKDVVTELLNEGTDTVISTASSYILSSNVENLTLSGTSAINGTGNGSANTITGNSNNNVLNGGAGIDTLSYSNATKGVKVSLATTAQQDTLGAGKDTISNFENLTGSSYADTLTGNSAANTLNGGTGADTLKGGLGSDIYYVDNVGDKIVETTSSSISQSGTDTVNSSITYILQDDLENLTLLGTANIDATGNYQNNILLGNSGKNILDGGKGNDILNGGAGADTMKGGNGKDTYYVDNIGDIVVEEYTTVSYTDTVNSTISYTLTDYVEDLNLIGTSAINGTGNSLHNTITGNAANNTLTGGTGSDKFVFNTKLGSTNIDKITDFNVLYDEIQLENAIFTKLATAYTLNKANFVSNDTGKAVDANDYLVYNKTNGQLFYDVDGNGAGAAVLFAVIENKASLTYADFTVI